MARLTGTTVNTIRHYHKLGLLTEPDRMSNGCKQYGASHLLRLHQIRRMRELGVPLTDIGSVDDDHEQQQLALKQLEVDLGEQIAPSMKRQLEAKPWLLALTERMTGDVKMGQAAIIGSLRELYNDAQIDVIQRAFISVFPKLDIPDADRERFIAFIKHIAAKPEG